MGPESRSGQVSEAVTPAAVTTHAFRSQYLAFFSLLLALQPSAGYGLLMHKVS
jgi:hypothetical protein